MVFSIPMPVPLYPHSLTAEEGWHVEGRRGNSSLVQGLWQSTQVEFE